MSQIKHGADQGGGSSDVSSDRDDEESLHGDDEDFHEMDQAILRDSSRIFRPGSASAISSINNPKFARDTSNEEKSHLQHFHEMQYNAQHSPMMMANHPYPIFAAHSLGLPTYQPMNAFHQIIPPHFTSLSNFYGGDAIHGHNPGLHALQFTQQMPYQHQIQLQHAMQQSESLQFQQMAALQGMNNAHFAASGAMPNYTLSHMPQVMIMPKPGGHINPSNLSYMHPTFPFAQPSRPIGNQALASYVHEKQKDVNGTNPPQKRTKRELPDWLESKGDFVHSDAQLKSGADLSKMKRKYKIVRCKYCAEYNSTDAPWAVAKSRKFEAENFQEHERSTHHMKAVLRRSLQLGISLSQNFANPNQRKVPLPLPLSHSSSSSQGEFHPLNTDANSLSQAMVYMRPMDMTESDYLSRHIESRSARKAPLMKTRQAPVWLKSEGKLVHSERQVLTGSNLSKVKKKYKLIMCTICQQFNPSSPWAHWKTRKYEAAVLNEHERSHHHRKALTSRDLAMGSVNFDGFGACQYQAFPEPPPQDSFEHIPVEGGVDAPVEPSPIVSAPVESEPSTIDVHTTFATDGPVHEPNDMNSSMLLRISENLEDGVSNSGEN